MQYIDTKHYHYTTGRSYYNRATYYHQHPGSFVIDDDGNYTHNHAEEPAVYLSPDRKERFLSPADKYGAD